MKIPKMSHNGSGGDFVEGIYFYWFSWIVWVFATFLMKKSRERTEVSFVILLALAMSNSVFQIAGFSIRASFLVLLLFSFMLLTKTKGLLLLYYLISSLIITIGYVCFHLFELFDPVWLIFDRKLLLSFIVLYLILMLVKDFYYRLAIAMVGACNGELLYFFILKRFSFEVELGSLSSLDALSAIIFFIVTWSSLEKLAQFFEANFHKGKARRIHK